MDPIEYNCEDGLCPDCQDECLEVGEWPIWATDAGEVYRFTCPCGYVWDYAECFTPEEMDEFVAFDRLMEA